MARLFQSGLLPALLLASTGCWVQGETLVFHPRYGTGPKPMQEIGYHVDGRRFVDAATVVAETTLDHEAVQWDAAGRLLVLPKEFGDWPNVLSLSDLGAANRPFLESLLGELLKYAPNAAEVRARVLAASDAGERVVLGRDFITSVTREFRTWYEVHYGLLVFLDDREAIEIKVNPHRELGTLLDDHVDRLNLLLDNRFSPGTEWHLCLRGNHERRTYDAMVIREQETNVFALMRIDCDCQVSPGVIPLPGVPPGDPPDEPEKPPGCPPPVIEFLRRPQMAPPWQPPVVHPGGAVKPPGGPDANRPGRLLPGPDGELVTPGPPPRRRDPESPPTAPDPESWLDQQAFEAQPAPAVLEALKTSTDVTVDDTYAEVNRWIREEQEAWEVWNAEVAGKYVNGTIGAHEPRLLRGGLVFSDGSVADPEVLILDRLRAMAARLGGTVEILTRQDLSRNDFASPRLQFVLPCGDCVSGPYDEMAYTTWRDALEGELSDLQAEKDQLRIERDAIAGLYPHLGWMASPGAPWETLLGCGVTLPGATVTIGSGFGIEGWDLTTFFSRYLSKLLYNSKFSFRECCELATRMYAMEAFVGEGGVPEFSEVIADPDGFEAEWIEAANASGGPNRAAARMIIQVVNSYCLQLRDAYAEAFAEKVFADGMLSADEIRVIVDRAEGLTPDERDALDELNDVRLRLRYLDLLCVFVRHALADLDCQRALCIRQYREDCINPQKCIDFAIHMLAQAYCEFAESARASGGSRWEFAQAELPCNCDAYRQILADPGAYPPGFVDFIRCLRQRDCPEPSDPPREVALAVQAQGAGAVSVIPPTGPYFAGDFVTLEILPAPGGIFTGWSGALRGDDHAVTLRLEDDTEVTAHFVQAVALEIVPGSAGQVNGAYLPGTFVEEGSLVLLQADPAPGFFFAGWAIEGGPEVDPHHRLAFLLDGFTTLTPLFRPVAGAVDAEPRLEVAGVGATGAVFLHAEGLPGTRWEIEVSPDGEHWLPAGQSMHLLGGVAEATIEGGGFTTLLVRLSAPAPDGEGLLDLFDPSAP